MEFFCKCVDPNEAQSFKKYINPRNQQEYEYGECRHCRKRLLIRNNELLTGRRAKEIWERIKGKTRRAKDPRFDDYRSKCSLDLTTYPSPRAKKVIINGESVRVEYQAEEYFVSGYVAGRDTLKEVCDKLAV